MRCKVCTHWAEEHDSSMCVGCDPREVIHNHIFEEWVDSSEFVY